MSLSGVLVDRARVWTYTTLTTPASPGSPGVPVRVEGTTQMEWSVGQWFACRLDSPAAPRTRDAATGRERADQKPMMIFELEDDDGNPVELHADVRVEVESEDLGLMQFDVSGEPTLDRRKEGFVCGEVSLDRIVDQWPAGRPHSGAAQVGVGVSAMAGVGQSGTATTSIGSSGSGAVV